MVDGGCASIYLDFVLNFLGSFAGGHGSLAPRVRALHVISCTQLMHMHVYAIIMSDCFLVETLGMLSECSLLQAPPFPSQVVYNRVGKCGSRTIVLLLRMLADRHRFTLISSDIHNKTRLTKREQVIKNDHCQLKM